MLIRFLAAVIILIALPLSAQPSFEKDILKTSDGDLTLTFIGHGTLMFEFGGKIIHIDPVSRYANYAHLPKADLILITHQHGDHMDTETIALLSKANTVIIATEICAQAINNAMVMKNGDKQIQLGIAVEAAPAYNIVNKRDGGQPFHPKGEGNGYILTFGNKHVYIAGDTENIPEMKTLKDIDVAFLPMNLPYTMSPEMVAAAAKSFTPGILYPYHYGNTDTQKLLDLMRDVKEIEIRIRKLQ